MKIFCTVCPILFAITVVSWKFLVYFSIPMWNEIERERESEKWEMVWGKEWKIQLNNFDNLQINMVIVLCDAQAQNQQQDEHSAQSHAIDVKYEPNSNSIVHSGRVNVRQIDAPVQPIVVYRKFRIQSTDNRQNNLLSLLNIINWVNATRTTTATTTT